jgi:hypothetical protein
VQAYPDLRRAPDQYVHPASSADTTVLPAFGGPAQPPMIPDGGPQVPEEDRLSGADLARPRVLGYEIADDLFLLMLDDRSGRLRVHGDVVGAVLAAALLAELAAGDWIVVGDEALEPGPVAVRRERVPVDALAHLTLETILGRRELRGVREWIAVLAGTAERDVAERLGRAKRISVKRRRGFGGGNLYPPTNTNDAAWPRARISDHCRSRRRLDFPDVVLVGLCHAAGLLHNVLDDAPDGTYEAAMRQVTDRLAQRPSVTALLIALESSVRADASALA